jgi:hypothetical protein
MRKLVWGGIVACLFTGGLGVYFSLSTRQEPPALPVPDAEEQETPVVVPFAVGEMVHAAPAGGDREANEPIVVEGTTVEPPTVAEVGGAPLPGQGGVAVAGTEQPPRPDEEPGQEQKMPYVPEVLPAPTVLTQFWDTICRMVGGVAIESAKVEATAPVKDELPPETPEPPVVPVRDYHYHQQEMHCPYPYARCPVPTYPVPPPAAPENK